MAQPAVSVVDDRTDVLGVPIFWPKPTSGPPSSWDSWIGQLNSSITSRENCDPRELLKTPEAVHDDLAPMQQVTGRSENASSEANLIARDAAAFRNEEG